MDRTNKTDKQLQFFKKVEQQNKAKKAETGLYAGQFRANLYDITTQNEKIDELKGEYAMEMNKNYPDKTQRDKMLQKAFMDQKNDLKMNQCVTNMFDSRAKSIYMKTAGTVDIERNSQYYTNPDFQNSYNIEIFRSQLGKFVKPIDNRPQIAGQTAMRDKYQNVRQFTIDDATFRNGVGDFLIEKIHKDVQSGVHNKAVERGVLDDFQQQIEFAREGAVKGTQEKGVKNLFTQQADNYVAEQAKIEAKQGLSDKIFYAGKVMDENFDQNKMYNPMLKREYKTDRYYQALDEAEDVQNNVMQRSFARQGMQKTNLYYAQMDGVDENNEAAIFNPYLQLQRGLGYKQRNANTNLPVNSGQEICNLKIYVEPGKLIQDKRVKDPISDVLNEQIDPNFRRKKGILKIDHKPRNYSKLDNIETQDNKQRRTYVEKLDQKGLRNTKMTEEDEFDVLNYQIQVRNEIGHSRGQRGAETRNDLGEDRCLPRAFHGQKGQHNKIQEGIVQDEMQKEVKSRVDAVRGKHDKRHITDVIEEVVQSKKERPNVEKTKQDKRKQDLDILDDLQQPTYSKTDAIKGFHSKTTNIFQLQCEGDDGNVTKEVLKKGTKKKLVACKI